ncbi:MAG: MFS transporter [Pseudonocardia sp.]
MTTQSAVATRSARAELFGSERRTTTIGLLLLISMIAFEAMGVGTAMPAVVADLGVVALYAWPFVAFSAASVVATVLGGRWCDVAGPRLPLIAAPAVFGAGLVVAGTATSIAQLLTGRVLQGLGAGVAVVAAYVLIAAVYPRRVRPAVFGWMSAAWVLPSLVGPPVAGVVTERFSWHWVFLGLVPVVLVALALVGPATRGLGAPGDGAAPPRRGLVVAALGAAVGVAGLSWASQSLSVAGAVAAALALLVLVPALARLLPAGTIRARRGVPAVVLSRGLLAGTFFAANTYVPLLLTATHGWSLTAAAVPLVVASLGWSLASAWQGRHPDLSRPKLLVVGFTLVATGAAALALAAPAWGSPWLAFAWLTAGVGMGLGYSAISYLVLALSAPGDVGFHTSASQLADQLSTAALIGAGGALLVLFVSPAVALPVLLVGLAALATLGAVLAPRTAG